MGWVRRVCAGPIFFFVSPRFEEIGSAAWHILACMELSRSLYTLPKVRRCPMGKVFLDQPNLPVEPKGDVDDLIFHSDPGWLASDR